MADENKKPSESASEDEAIKDKHTKKPDLQFSQTVMSMLQTLLDQRKQIDDEILRIAEVIEGPTKAIGEIVGSFALEMSLALKTKLTTVIHPDIHTANEIYNKLVLYVEDVISEYPDYEYQYTLLDEPFLLKAAEIARAAGEDIPKLLIEPQTYRTKSKAQNADSIAGLPKSLSTITLPGFHNGLSFYESDPKGKAHLQLIKDESKLMFRDGQMFFEGMPASTVQLKDNKTNENIENIDLPLLKMFYSIILYKFKTSSDYKHMNPIVTLHISDLAAYMGIDVSKSGLHRKDIERIIGKTKSFHNIIGVITEDRNGTPAQSYFPVFNFEGYDDKQATVSFSSPYMNHLIDMVYRTAIRRQKDGTPKLYKNGQPQLRASHSYLIHSSIARQKNKAAAENVGIIVTIIEQAGDNTPNISAKTLIDRNPGLAQRLQKSARPNQLLERVFRATWKMLREETDLEITYKDIVLPDPDSITNIPTMNTLNKVFEFPHKGKKSPKTET